MITTRTICPEVQRHSDVSFTVEKLDEPISHPAMQLLASRVGAVIIQMYDTAYDAKIVTWTDERAGKTEVKDDQGL